MKNDARASDDWATALAKRWQYNSVIHRPYPQFDYTGELSWFLYKRSSSGLARSNHSERSGDARPLQKHDARMAPRCSGWADG